MELIAVSWPIIKRLQMLQNPGESPFFCTMCVFYTNHVLRIVGPGVCILSGLFIFCVWSVLWSSQPPGFSFLSVFFFLFCSVLFCFNSRHVFMTSGIVSREVVRANCVRPWNTSLLGRTMFTMCGGLVGDQDQQQVQSSFVFVPRRKRYGVVSHDLLQSHRTHFNATVYFCTFSHTELYSLYWT